jgi:prepilin-type N-terminal cleavage/methylation domain-containing protein
VSRREAGFSLIEILVAVTLLGIALVGVAQLNFVLARRFYTLSRAPAREGIVAQQVNQFAAMPFDSLMAQVGTKTFTKPPMPYTRIVTVDTIGSKLRRVKIVIQPSNPAIRPDSVVIERTKPAPNPFNKKP